jgi:membrane fusion protein (multidrug efflux system)
MMRHPKHNSAWWILSALGPALLLVAAGCNTEGNPQAQAQPTPKSIAVTTVPAQERMLPGGLDVTGTLMADARTDVASETEKKIVQVLVERGTTIKEGAVLVRLDDEDAINTLREAEATEAQTRERLGLKSDQPFDPAATGEVMQARAALDRAEADFKRFAQLIGEGAVSRAEHDFRRADYLSAKAQYETTLNQVRNLYQLLQAQQARVAIARKGLENTVIRAPFGGLVAEKYVDVGSYAKKGEKLVTLVRVDPLRVELAIPEGAVAAVKKGQRVSFSVQSYPNHRFEGTIAYVGPALRADSRALVVEALVQNGNGMLQPGLFATARIELPASRRSILVPTSAVRTEAGVSLLFVSKDSRAEQRIVQIGREIDKLVEIVSGVGAGERVVAQATDRLADGAPITESNPGAR